METGIETRQEMLKINISQAIAEAFIKNSYP